MKFADNQVAYIEQAAAEYRAALKTDIILWLRYSSNDASLRHYLREADEQGNPYASSLSSFDFRTEIEHPGSFRQRTLHKQQKRAQASNPDSSRPLPLIHSPSSLVPNGDRLAQSVRGASGSGHGDRIRMPLYFYVLTFFSLRSHSVLA